MDFHNSVAFSEVRREREAEDKVIRSQLEIGDIFINSFTVKKLISTIESIP